MGKKFRTGTVLITLIMALSFYSTVFAAFKYEHDPMENPKAAQDIVVDPNAVYGYAPNPNSTRLKEFASYDWSDQKAVEEMKKQRRDLPKEANAGGIIGFTIWSICALIMIGIGVWSWRSQKAVGFFTGVKAPEVKDVVKYNHSVAILWFAYGILFEAFGIPLLFFKQNSGEFVITFFGTILSTLALVIGYTVILKKHQRPA